MQDESTPTPFDTPQPFDQRPRSPKAGRGLNTKFLIGCAGVLIVVALLMLLLMAKSQDLLLWAYDQTATQALEQAAEDLSPAERTRLEEALAGARAALVERRIEIDGLWQLKDGLEILGAKDLDQAGYLRAIELLEEVAAEGVRAPEINPISAGRPSARFMYASSS